MLRKIGIIALFFVLLLSACKTQHSVTQKESEHQGLKSSPSSALIDSVLHPYKNTVTSKISQTLITATNNLNKDGDEMALGNFVCDAMKWAFDSITNKANTCIVLMNRGGLRTTLNKGMITVNSIFELMPFDNKLEMVEIYGKELRQIIPIILEKRHAFLGMKIIGFKDLRYSVTIDGKEIEEQQIYKIVASDFLITGGDNFTFGEKKLSITSPNLKIRDALIYYCMHLNYNNKTITAYKDGRLEISK